MSSLSGNIRAKGSGSSGPARWGNISGTITDQSDLIALLEEKQDVIDENNKISVQYINGLPRLVVVNDEHIVVDDYRIMNIFKVTRDGISGTVIVYDDGSMDGGMIFTPDSEGMSTIYQQIQGQITAVENEIPTDLGDLTNNAGYIKGIPNDVKDALLELASKVAYVDNSGQAVYDALEESFYVVDHITAVYTQGQTVVYPTTSLDDLKTNLVVTAYYTDETTKAVTNYTLSGTLTEGTSTVTVTYKNKTATFDVTVSAPPTVQSISAVYSGGSVTAGASVDSLKANTVVTALYTDSHTETVPSTDYTLSGDLSTSGTKTVTVSYDGKTTTFTVTVIEQVVLSSISAVYSGGTVSTTASLDSLKTNLVVTAHYSDSTTQTVASADYTLSGDISTVGTHTITVSYSGKTTTFSVTSEAQQYLYSKGSADVPTLTTHGGTSITNGVVSASTNNHGMALISSSVSSGTTYGAQYPWYYQQAGTSVGRFAYPMFDIALEHGKKYRYTFDCNYKDRYVIRGALQYFNQTYKNDVETTTDGATAHNSDYYDTTWTITADKVSITDAPIELTVPDYATSNGTSSGTPNTAGGYIVGTRFAFKLQQLNSTTEVTTIPTDLTWSVLIEEVTE